jgi:hypothetical protein
VGDKKIALRFDDRFKHKPTYEVDPVRQSKDHVFISPKLET